MVTAQNQLRTYNADDCIIFMKTKEQFGGLSNMAAGYSLQVNTIAIRTAEALYQACRFPHRSDIQDLIIMQKSPMAAKMKSKSNYQYSRPDWNIVRVSIMRWTLRVKLAQNWSSFSALLFATGQQPIVEESRRDAFWGAQRRSDTTLVGANILGRLLMELRQELLNGHRDHTTSVNPLPLPHFLLKDQPITAIQVSNYAPPQPTNLTQTCSSATTPHQPVLFRLSDH
jgi:type I restriction enzyme S subunit